MTLHELCNFSFEKCSLCGDDWEDTVYFPGEEEICHELDSKIFVEEEVAYDSERCKTSQSFYSETCCIQTPDKPCDICTLNGVNFMKSDVKVSYKGEVQTCLQVYHLLYSRREETSGDCINAQVELFEQCCEAKSTPIPVDIVDESAPPSPAGVSKVPNAWTAPISPEFDSWYAGPLLSSASSSTASMCLLLLPITVWLC
ncbi:hypothetical protein ACHAW5_007050 [Stephanodiscus triporus]|uniref:Uncharacterized protein n=1 Tax=Stephanodiscus triporus TaxID=2934178 RepID=A0ABD3P7Q1_9STRA